MQRALASAARSTPARADFTVDPARTTPSAQHATKPGSVPALMMSAGPFRADVADGVDVGRGPGSTRKGIGGRPADNPKEADLSTLRGQKADGPMYAIDR